MIRGLLPKTPECNRDFDQIPHNSSLEGAIYKTEICAILLLLRCPFRWNPFMPEPGENHGLYIEAF